MGDGSRMRNVSLFQLGNITDTCAVWNVLSSPRLLAAATRSRCQFAMTRVVLYECLIKPRSRQNPADLELQNRLKRERAANRFSDVPLSLEDVQEIAQLEKRRSLGHGELSSIVFARRAQTAFCSDDLNAQRLAEGILGYERVQTTPHLLGWLVFAAALSDNDIEQILHEHEQAGRPLSPHLRAMYEEGLRCRLLAQTASAPRNGTG